MSHDMYADVIRTKTEGMKRKRVETMVEIYESADHVRDHDFRTETNTLQPLQHGWKLNQSSCYYISSEKKSWTESKRYCMERGAGLIIINNREEQDFVRKMSDGADVCIGLTDVDVENTWKWVDGSTLTTGFWGHKEPNGKRGENCALTYKSWWNDYPCSETFKWICEKKVLK
uniref:C-type lectin domain-containing protein n=1 Tax=Sinocyclocheilus rhinocerous TaxID=307959 RepID=A0A673KBA9_9TELE